MFTYIFGASFVRLAKERQATIKQCMEHGRRLALTEWTSRHFPWKQRLAGEQVILATELPCTSNRSINGNTTGVIS